MNEVVIVNEQDEVIGTMPKDEAHKTGVPHRIAVVYVEDGAGRFLIQIRMSGALDHSSAGHVDPGESYEDAAARELAEELGITGVELRRIGHGTSNSVGLHDGVIRTHVFDAFVCMAEPGELQADEVKGVYWADPHEVLQDMQSGASGADYAGGFRASLPLYVAYLEEKTA